jgi:hypothetical protein
VGGRLLDTLKAAQSNAITNATAAANLRSDSRQLVP